jgi:hypothetical protein
LKLISGLGPSHVYLCLVHVRAMCFWVINPNIMSKHWVTIFHNPSIHSNYYLISWTSQFSCLNAMPSLLCWRKNVYVYIGLPSLISLICQTLQCQKEKKERVIQELRFGLYCCLIAFSFILKPWKVYHLHWISLHIIY